jgi:hypothetical protein
MSAGRKCRILTNISENHRAATGNCWQLQRLPKRWLTFNIPRGSRPKAEGTHWTPAAKTYTVYIYRDRKNWFWPNYSFRFTSAIYERSQWANKGLLWKIQIFYRTTRLRSYLYLLTAIFCVVPQCNPADVLPTFQKRLLPQSSGQGLLTALTMQEARISETSVNFYQITGCNNPEDNRLHTRRR